MYHAIVKRIALQNFLRVNQKDYTPILKGCSPDIHHRFGGHHALGGERHDREALRQWFERLGRLAPTLQLTVHDVWVKGGPWNTTVIMRWSAVQNLPDGSPYKNHGVHIIRALGQSVRYRCKRGLTTCCRIFADMGRIWRERSSCRSNSELAVIPAPAERIELIRLLKKVGMWAAARLDDNQPPRLGRSNADPSSRSLVK